MLVNMLISHPKVCISSGETHKVFKPPTDFDTGWPRLKKRFLYDYPIRLVARQDFFRPRLLEERRPIPSFLKSYIDRILYHGRFDAMVETHNLYQYEGIRYTRDELAGCRLLTKGLDGIVFTGEIFHEMYPDATFLALVRNGLAICEGYVRRGGSGRAFGRLYVRVARKMLDLKNRIPGYQILRYEDMVSDPVEFLRRVYSIAGLNTDEVPKIRLLTRPITDRDGQRVIAEGEYKRVFWYTLDELRKTVRSDINENQIRQLKEAEKQDFLSVAGKMMEELGYPTG
jgi:hypothetical protein